jgi:hypothetical protein
MPALKQLWLSVTKRLNLNRARSAKVPLLKNTKKNSKFIQLLVEQTAPFAAQGKRRNKNKRLLPTVINSKRSKNDS